MVSNYQQGGNNQQGGNYQITYNVDMVFCIDATGSMGGVIDMVKRNAVSFLWRCCGCYAEERKDNRQA